MYEDDIQNFTSHGNVESGNCIIMLDYYRKYRVDLLWKCSYMDELDKRCLLNCYYSGTTKLKVIGLLVLLPGVIPTLFQAWSHLSFQDNQYSAYSPFQHWP